MLSGLFFTQRVKNWKQIVMNMTEMENYYDEEVCLFL